MAEALEDWAPPLVRDDAIYEGGGGWWWVVEALLGLDRPLAGAAAAVALYSLRLL